MWAKFCDYINLKGTTEKVRDTYSDFKLVEVINKTDIEEYMMHRIDFPSDVPSFAEPADDATEKEIVLYLYAMLYETEDIKILDKYTFIEQDVLLMNMFVVSSFFGKYVIEIISDKTNMPIMIKGFKEIK